MNTPTIEEIESMTLAQFGGSNRELRVNSTVLGEQVVFVSDDYARKADDPPTYTATELLMLVDGGDVLLRAVHAAKKNFPGAVVSRQRRRR